MMEDSNFQQLPGGRCYQKGGCRLEQASYNCLPEDIKKNTLTNLRPKKENGDVIVEYDMIYSKGDEMISFEIKGLNNNTSRCPDRQQRLLNQAIRQRLFLMEHFKSKNLKIIVIFCLVKGKNNDIIDQKFIDSLINNDIMVAIGASPNETIKNAIKQLKDIGFLAQMQSKSIEIKNIQHANKQIVQNLNPHNHKNNTILIGSPDKVSYLDKLITSNKKN